MLKEFIERVYHAHLKDARLANEEVACAAGNAAWRARWNEGLCCDKSSERSSVFFLMFY